MMMKKINNKLQRWGRRSTTTCSDGEEDQQQHAVTVKKISNNQ